MENFIYIYCLEKAFDIDKCNCKYIADLYIVYLMSTKVRKQYLLFYVICDISVFYMLIISIVLTLDAHILIVLLYIARYK